jgi:ribosomal protein S18 acetylase RimI-like enzyme
MSTSNSASEDQFKSEIIIREMSIDDLAAVFHLGERLFTASKVPNLYRTWDEYEILEPFQLNSELCLVAEAKGTVVGFALATTIEKARSAWKYGHLVWLGVDPPVQKRGVGARLFHSMRTQMTREGVRIIMVDTETDNVGGLRFFQKMGFAKPLPHIYLSLNLSNSRRQDVRKRGTSGADSER